MGWPGDEGLAKVYAQPHPGCETIMKYENAGFGGDRIRKFPKPQSKSPL
jgi:hypothetical protein